MEYQKSQEDFLKAIAGIKELAYLQGGFVTEEDIKNVFGELSEQQRKILNTYFKDSKIGVEKPLPDSDYLSDEDGSYLRLYMEELENIEPLTEAQKRAYIMAAMNDDNAAKELLTNTSLKTVVDLARLYTGQGVELYDLIGEGNFALVSAMSMLDCIEQPEEFDGFVAKTIMTAMEGLIGEENKEEEVLQRTMAKVMDVITKAKELTEAYRRKVSVKELASETDLTEEDIRQAIELATVTCEEFITDDT